jgi:hypothetical protein
MSFNTRRDARLTITRALPAQNTNVNSTAIDLGSVVNGAVGNFCEFVIDLPATPSLANGQTMTITIQDSADNSSFAAVAGLSTLVVTGAGGVGAAAASRRVRLPSTLRRYVGINIAASATTGDNTAVSATFRIET